MTGLDVRELGVERDGKVVLKNVSLAVQPSERVFVMGPSGSGKSTLLQAIAGLIPVSSGSCTLDGAGPDAMGWPAWRRSVTYVAQAPAHLGTSAMHWLDALCGLRAQSPGLRRAVHIAADWGIERGLWERPYERLSGGERQRIHVAIGVASAPRVLLFDEPLTGLDPESAEHMERSLAEQTCIWVTHDPSRAHRLATHTVELS